ncbi:hypothetical protein BC829DRAFT_421980 [Chytridium lagenaria]|nr:hypothetical protein BC829DRAFT_421980 [Chytridium lagenaria]
MPFLQCRRASNLWTVVGEESSTSPVLCNSCKTSRGNGALDTQSTLLEGPFSSLINPPDIPSRAAAEDPAVDAPANQLSFIPLPATTPPPSKKAKRSAGSTKPKKTDAGPISSEFLLNVVVVFKFKDFQGNRTKPTAKETIPVDSVENFYSRVWERIKMQVKRLVMVPEGKGGLMEWIRKQNIPNTIVDKSRYEKLVKTLLKKVNADRSGAANAEAIRQIQARLMVLHKENYNGTTHAWFQLAATIASKPKDEQEGFILCPSQLDDIKRFQRPADNFEATHRHFEAATKVALNETRSGLRLCWGSITMKLNT